MTDDEPRRIPRYLRHGTADPGPNPVTAIVTAVPRGQLELDLLAEQDRLLELTGEVARLRAERDEARSLLRTVLEFGVEGFVREPYPWLRP